MTLATDIDPTPWGQWVALAIGLLTLLGILIGVITWGWKHTGLPDVREAVRAEMDRRDARHAAEHTELLRKIENHAALHRTEHAELDQRIDAVDSAREASVRHLHGRIDGVILGRHAT